MTKPKLGATNWNAAVHRAMRANQAARRNLSQLLDEQPGPQRQALLLALAAQNLSENLDALIELREIGKNAKRMG